MKDFAISKRLTIRGIVQGVGFRPFVFTQAEKLGLTGWIRNTASGVEIEVKGPSTQIKKLIHTLKYHPPPLARIDSISAEKCSATNYADFQILASVEHAEDFLPISPDISICNDCQEELFDPRNRRFRYPFINCTNCGPRFSIIKDIPYDRPNTTMANFEMCPQCKAEYENPRDRRFHAQPIACPECGPKLWLEGNSKIIAKDEVAIQTARDWISQGKIIAIKGLGGFHLACDATNIQSVQTLRKRKKRSDKPFALMAYDLSIIRKHCSISEDEEKLLLSKERPVVILSRLLSSNIVNEVALNLNTLGFMLPYTPLHFLLMQPEANYPEVLVMTSGNFSEEPIAYTDEHAHEILSDIADAFLLHDREIHTRIDDSVYCIINKRPYAIRRSRGYAPNPIQIQQKVPQIFSAGAGLKNTFCLTRDDYAFISHHIGDLENLETLQAYERSISYYEKLFRIQPVILTCDLHPDYLSSQYAIQRAEKENLPIIQVQHHHAHLAACLADNSFNDGQEVIGVCLDGIGYGSDGNIWGGEFLLGNYRTYQRIYHLKYVPMPGGDQATLKPSRMALAYLWSSGIDWAADLAPVQATPTAEVDIIRSQLRQRINTPLTSSMGRLFDAAASILGICQEINYEAQAAIEMENMVTNNEENFYYFNIYDEVIDPTPLWDGLISDLRKSISIPQLATRFHNSIVNIILQVCQKIKKETGVQIIALSGGVWQNRYLLEHTLLSLSKAGFEVLWHSRVPTNDGGIALGQTLVAASVYKQGK
jgi:hydrogenase maturation protein HypF